MDQTYYSIDNNPEVCAQAVAALIKADQVSQVDSQPGFNTKFNRQEFEEAAQRLAESMTDIHRTFGEAILKAFSRNFRP